MTVNHFSIHKTTTNKIQDAERESWEFVCPTCDYRARYVVHPTEGTSQLEILHMGDSQARHTSHHLSKPPNPQWPEPAPDGDESWLTPELRRQLEELLRDVDMGDDDA